MRNMVMRLIMVVMDFGPPTGHQQAKSGSSHEEPLAKGIILFYVSIFHSVAYLHSVELVWTAETIFWEMTSHITESQPNNMAFVICC